MLWREAHDGAQLSDTGFEAAELEQTMGEIKPGTRMLGNAREHLAELRRRALELTFEQQGGATAVQRTDVVRRKRKRAHERGLGVGWLGTADVDTSKLDRELGDAGCELDALLEHDLSIVIAVHAAKDKSELVERGREDRLAADRALKPVYRLVSASHVAKRQRIVCLERRIVSLARRISERTNGVARTLLDQEGNPQEVQHSRILRMPAQEIARNALCFIWATLIKDHPTEMKDLVIRRNGSSIRALVVHVRPTPSLLPRGRLGHRAEERTSRVRNRAEANDGLGKFMMFRSAMPLNLFRLYTNAFLFYVSFILSVSPAPLRHSVVSIQGPCRRAKFILASDPEGAFRSDGPTRIAPIRRTGLESDPSLDARLNARSQKSFGAG